MRELIEVSLLPDVIGNLNEDSIKGCIFDP